MRNARYAMTVVMKLNAIILMFRLKKSEKIIAKDVRKNMKISTSNASLELLSYMWSRNFIKVIMSLRYWMMVKVMLKIFTKL